MLMLTWLLFSVGPVQGIGLAGSAANNPFSGWPYGLVVGAGTVLDERREVAGEQQRAIAVAEVFFGDRQIRKVFVPELATIPPVGQRVLVMTQGDSYGSAIRSSVIPDTPDHRRDVLQALAARQRPNFRADFVDEIGLLQQAENLVRSFLQQLAGELPDHPQLGTNAVAGITVQRCPAPAGVFVSVHGPLDWRGRWQQVKPVPRKDEVVLWVAAALEPFTVGHPLKERNQSALLGLMTADDPANLGVRGIMRQLQGQYLRLEYCLVLREWNGRSRVADAIELCLQSLQERCRAINQDPPRDLEAAIQTVAARHVEILKERAATVGQFVPGFVVANSAPYGLSPLGRAYEALASGFAQEHFTGKQKQRLVPALIDLLTDRQVVANFTPSDGPVTASHQRAYALLRMLTRQEFPAPLADLPAVPAAAAAETSRRQAEWKQWWVSNPKLGN